MLIPHLFHTCILIQLQLHESYSYLHNFGVDPIATVMCMYSVHLNFILVSPSFAHACICARKVPEGACIPNRCTPGNLMHGITCILRHLTLFCSRVAIFIWIIISNEKHNENTLID